MTTRRSPWDNLNSRRSVLAKSNTPHPQSRKDQEKEKTLDLNGKKTETTSKKQVENPYQLPHLSKCFQCGQTGHLSNSCHQRMKEKSQTMIKKMFFNKKKSSLNQMMGRDFFVFFKKSS